MTEQIEMTEQIDHNERPSRQFPTGVVTIMFTDIEGSTRLSERFGKIFELAREQHNQIVRECLAMWDGYEVKYLGDGFMASFARATDAVECAIEIQRRLAQSSWPAEIGEIRVRIGLHIGEPFIGYGTGGLPDYFGPVVNRAARICDAAHGGQILISQAVYEVLQGAISSDIEIIDLKLHRLKGLERAESIFQVYHPDLPRRDFPPLRTLDFVAHNLPVQLTSFIGREKELSDLIRLLREPTTRLLTLTGPGGVGKTRLALQVAAECADEFADGVWFIRLDEVRDPEGVPSEIANALRIQLDPALPAHNQLISILPHRNLLLICDNFEQVIDAASFLGDLLRAAPKVKCIVTSRSPLHIRGERIYEVPPMPQPPPDAAPHELLLYDSVVLFIERARDVRPGWEVTAETAPVVAELCRQLEGIPLCIELAAARLRGMTPQEILKGLSHRFRLLTSRSPDLPERQRTLRGTIDWSYNLLTDEERTLLAQLSVFRGGFFMEAAEAIIGNPEVIDLILQLYDHSLLQARCVGERTRYILSEAVHEYAAEKLQLLLEDSSIYALHHRHATYFLKFAEERDGKVRTEKEAIALEEMAYEIDNFRAALGWAVIHDNYLCARLAVALNNFFERRGLWDDALFWAERGLESARKVGDQKLIAELLLNLAGVHQNRGELEKAKAEAEESLQLWECLNDIKGKAKALNLLGIVYHDIGDDDEAVRLHKEALALRQQIGDRVGEAISLHNLGYIAQYQGDFVQAEQYYQQSLIIRQQVGDQRGVAETLCNLGVIAQERLDYTAAKSRYRECLQIWHELGDRAGVAMALHNLGEVAVAEGKIDTALPLLTTAAKIFREIGSPFSAESEKIIQSLSGSPEAQPFVEKLQAAKAIPFEQVLKIAVG